MSILGFLSKGTWHRCKNLRLAPFRSLGASAESLGNGVSHEIKQARESKIGIHVMLDDVKGEIVEAAKGPHRNRQQNGYAKRGGQHQKQCRGSDPSEQKEKSFEVNQSRVFDVRHFDVPLLVTRRLAAGR
jgi:hypothetical protein